MEVLELCTVNHTSFIIIWGKNIAAFNCTSLGTLPRSMFMDHKFCYLYNRLEDNSIADCTRAFRHGHLLRYSFLLSLYHLVMAQSRFASRSMFAALSVESSGEESEEEISESEVKSSATTSR